MSLGAAAAQRVVGRTAARHDQCVTTGAMTNGGTTSRLLACNLGPFAGCVTAVHGDAMDTAGQVARAQLAAQVKRNVAAGSRTMPEVSRQTKYLDDESRAEFEQIAAIVRSAEQRLRSSLNELQSASEDEWPRAQAALAANYETFSHGIAQAERLLSAGPSSSRNDPQRR